ncbi:MAG TPA: hypothetical protein VN088_12355 [Nocardioides sp.]|nr:hypothetical protein [Nocardioides sp.]
MSARDICLSGVHHAPIDNIVVDRAIAAPLSAVKAWILGDKRIDWQTFSSSLKDAPLNERVAICVFSKRDGRPFAMPPGTNTPPPQQSVVEIVRSNGGEATLVVMGSLAGMLEVAPKSIMDLRRSTS